MSRVLLVTTNYWPEPTGIAVYTTDLAELLQGNDFEISVLTSLPHYPWWKVPKDFSHISEGNSQQNAVKIIRINHLIPPRMNALIRIRFELSLWRNLRKAAKKLVREDFDVIVACIPTVAAGIVGKNISEKLGVPFGLIVQDLSGAGASQSGLRGGALISKIAQSVEGSVLKAADSMVVVSPAMQDVVTSIGVPASKVLEITNYSARSIEVVNQDIARKCFGWTSDEFVVVHTGNMGAKQGLENVIEASKALGSDTNVRIYLIGHGNQEANLKKLCEGLSNISVMSAVADDQYSALLSSADLLLVNERSTQMDMSLPSKLTSYLYSERPVLAAVPRGGATWKFLDGVSELVDAGDPIALAKKIVELSNNPEKLLDLARRGKTFAENHLNPEVGRQKYLKWVESLVKLKNSN